MYKSIFYLLIVSVSLSLFAGCAATNQSSSFQNDMSMMMARKDMTDYKAVRDQFINYAKIKDEDNLYSMMAAYGYDKQEMLGFFQNVIFPFFSKYQKAVELDIFNMVKDENGNIGYTIYGFIATTSGEKKPYAIAIIEKDSAFAVKNIIVNKCFKGLHSSC